MGLNMLKVIENCVYPKRLEYAYDYALMEKHVAAEIIADNCLTGGAPSQWQIDLYVAASAAYEAIRVAYLGNR